MSDTTELFGHFYGDSYVESICVRCLMVVARALVRAELQTAEESHVCEGGMDANFNS